MDSLWGVQIVSCLPASLSPVVAEPDSSSEPDASNTLLSRTAHHREKKAFELIAIDIRGRGSFPSGGRHRKNGPCLRGRVVLAPMARNIYQTKHPPLTY